MPLKSAGPDEPSRQRPGNDDLVVRLDGLALKGGTTKAQTGGPAQGREESYAGKVLVDVGFYSGLVYPPFFSYLKTAIMQAKDKSSVYVRVNREKEPKLEDAAAETFKRQVAKEKSKLGWKIITDLGVAGAGLMAYFPLLYSSFTDGAISSIGGALSVLGGLVGGGALAYGLNHVGDWRALRALSKANIEFVKPETSDSSVPGSSPPS